MEPSQQKRQLVPTHIAARLLGIKPRTARQYAELGEIRAFKIGRGRGHWGFDEKDINEYLEKRRNDSNC